MSDDFCPACGGSDWVELEVNETISVPFASDAEWVQIERCCKSCNSNFLKGEDGMHKAVEERVRESVVTMLGILQASGRSRIYMERALGLPSKTLSDWESGEIPPSGLTLLRLIATHPQLVEESDRLGRNGVRTSQISVEDVIALFNEASNG